MTKNLIKNSSLKESPLQKMEKYRDHIPVLANELIEILNPKKGQIFVDCTLGLGGHSELLLKKIGQEGKLFALDLDKNNIEIAEKNLKKWSKNCKIIWSNFSEIKDQLGKQNIKENEIDGIIFDLGVSSLHFDLPERGFSINKKGPLDMRFNRTTGITAQEIVNTYPEKEIAQILKDFGEEREANRIARAITERRKDKTFKDTLELAEFIKSTKRIGRFDKTHPATKSFQALRIAVNNELDNLKIAIKDSLELLKVNGKLAIISFHSLEDRIVKNIFRDLSQSCTCPKELPKCMCKGKADYKLITRKAVKATDSEIANNSRARSARLRIIQKLPV